MIRDQMPESLPADRVAPAQRGQRACHRRPGSRLAAAVLLALAGTLAWVPAASASARTVPPSRHVPPGVSGRPVSGTMRPRAVKLPPRSRWRRPYRAGL